jgi:hypothetical protein
MSVEFPALCWKRSGGTTAVVRGVVSSLSEAGHGDALGVG